MATVNLSYQYRRHFGPDQEEIESTIYKINQRLCQDGNFERKLVYSPTYGYIVENEFLTAGTLNERVTKNLSKKQIDALKTDTVRQIKSIPAIYIQGSCGGYWKITRTTTPKEFDDIIDWLYDMGVIVIPDMMAFPG